MIFVVVTKEHEAPIDLFRRFPELLPTVMRELHVNVDLSSPFEVDFSSERCTENIPAELTADSVPLLKAGDAVKVAVILEVQRKQVESKLGAWVRYVASIWARHRAPTILLVFCENKTEAMKVKPIHLGPGSVITPHVISPMSMPPVTDLEYYRDRVDLAVFAALLHSEGPHAQESLRNVTELLANIAEEQAEKYAGCLIEILPDRHKEFLEDLMTAGTHAYQDVFARLETRFTARGMAKGMAEGTAKGMAKGMAEGRAKGRAEGRAEGLLEGEARLLLRVMEQRGFEVSDAVRARVMSCTESDQLEAWTDRTLKADSLDEVFAP